MITETTVAALHYGVTDRTIRRWVQAGQLTNYGTTRRIRVLLLDKMSAKVRSTGDVSVK